LGKRYTVFTYGTLMRGFYGHENFMQDAEFLGEATVNGDLRFFTLDYPVMIKKTKGGKPVRGELYSVDEKTLEKLRRYEGIGNPFTCYTEKNVTAQTKDGEVIARSFVVIPRIELAMMFTTRHIPECCWKKFKESRKRFPIPQPLLISLAASLFVAVVYELHQFGFLHL